MLALLSGTILGFSVCQLNSNFFHYDHHVTKGIPRISPVGPFPSKSEPGHPGIGEFERIENMNFRVINRSAFGELQDPVYFQLSKITIPMICLIVPDESVHFRTQQIPACIFGRSIDPTSTKTKTGQFCKG